MVRRTEELIPTLEKLILAWRSLTVNSAISTEHQLGMNHMAYSCADELQTAIDIAKGGS